MAQTQKVITNLLALPTAFVKYIFFWKIIITLKKNFYQLLEGYYLMKQFEHYTKINK